MNYKKLIKDSQVGLIDWDRFQLVVDNDSAYWSLVKEETPDDLVALKVIKNRYGVSDGKQDTVEILQAAGINAVEC